MNKRQFFKQKVQEVKEILALGTTNIACFKNNREVIAGYVVAHNRKISWMCVKKDFWNEGIQELLKKSVKDKIDE